MACPGSFPSCCEENDQIPKSGLDVDPGKLVWSMSCQEDVTDPSFSYAFYGFCPQFYNLCN